MCVQRLRSQVDTMVCQRDAFRHLVTVMHFATMHCFDRINRLACGALTVPQHAASVCTTTAARHEAPQPSKTHLHLCGCT